ncbi:MAG: sulfotransferase [Myxococcota bacterium]
MAPQETTSKETARPTLDRSVEEDLIFVISPPRAGSTLLQRMLGSHSDIFTHPEPHLITPLAYLGYFQHVDRAQYDHINSAEAMRLFVKGLPEGEEDYLDALRAYANTLYGRMLATSDRSRFLDKTPAYGLVLPFLTRLYPRAKYVVLTRHPLAVFSSYANSFFEGQWQTAHEFNPIVERYVPAMAKFLRERPVPLLHVDYEDLVTEPARALERIFAYCGLPNEPEAVDYGERFSGDRKGPGDPIGVQQHSRPVKSSVDKWAAELNADPKKLELAERMVSSLADEDLEAWGHSRATLFEPLTRAGQKPIERTRNRYTFQRRVFLALRKNIHERPHGRVIKRVKYYCDVLLRE